MSESFFDTRNGWRLYLHPAFRAQFDALVAEVAGLHARLPREAYERHPKVRILARIRKVILDDVPSDPASPKYELGNTLGSGQRHWRRAKFNQRFRLFFRFRSDDRIIIYGWLNGENTLRSRGARNDAYAVFKALLLSGNPPDSWEDLLSASSPPRD